jgi:hypothetical protein
MAGEVPGLWALLISQSAFRAGRVLKFQSDKRDRGEQEMTASSQTPLAWSFRFIAAGCASQMRRAFSVDAIVSAL